MREKIKQTSLKPMQFPNLVLVYFSLSWPNRKIILGCKVQPECRQPKICGARSEAIGKETYFGERQSFMLYDSKYLIKLTPTISCRAHNIPDHLVISNKDI